MVTTQVTSKADPTWSPSSKDMVIPATKEEDKAFQEAKATAQSNSDGKEAQKSHSNDLKVQRYFSWGFI